jgi:5-(carboxyamino)imidazole ribonucleotide mutase
MDRKVLVGIIMGSDSDLGVMIEAARMLERFGVAHEVDIVSAHRTPQKVKEYVAKAEKSGFKVIIAGAGGAAHLPGMTAAEAVIPVIGVPVASKTIGGGGFVDAVPSILQMPTGIPVATVGVNRADNAGILAAQIIATFDDKVKEKLLAYKKELNETVYKKSEKILDIGHEKYLDGMMK